MRSIISILLLFSLQSVFASDLKVELGAAKVSSDVQYVTFETQVACIVRHDPRSEGEEYAELYFVNYDAYSKHREYVQKGYKLLKKLSGGFVCSARNGNMILVHVGLYEKNDVIIDEIRKNNAIVNSRVVLINDNQFKGEIKDQVDRIIKGLTD